MRRSFFATLWGLSTAVIAAAVLSVAVPLAESGGLPGALPRLAGWGLLCGVVFGGALAWGAARIMTRPLARLTSAADRLARHGEALEMPETSVAEVARLGRAFAETARTLRTHLAQLTAERNQATAILEAMTEGVLALDATGRVAAVNAAAAALFQADPAQIRGRPLIEAVRHHELNRLAQQVLRDRQPAEAELSVFAPTARTLQARAVSCESEDPQGPRLVIVLQDLTALREYERLRREFVANVSHELRTPLTAIRGLTETLLEGALEDPANNRRFVSLIDEDSLRLTRLIDDLLQLSQLESGAHKPALQPVAVRALVERLLPTLRPEIDKRRLTVAVEVGAAVRAQADPDRLRQILLNVLQNAVKYNREQGTVRITAAPEGAMLRVSVADTGIGIPEADLPRLFERFYRVDKARSRELGGTGLGLSIVKHLVESHGGRTGVASRFGEGSTFWFTVPLA